jgi:hypothetical protein
MRDLEPPDPAHRIHLSATERGFSVGCSHGWVSLSEYREKRNADADAHLVAHDDG